MNMNADQLEVAKPAQDIQTHHHDNSATLSGKQDPCPSFAKTICPPLKQATFHIDHGIIAA